MTTDQIISLIAQRKVIKFNPETSPMQLTLAHSRGPVETGSLTTMSARLKPLEKTTSIPATNQHIIFVIDKSGSMQGDNFIAARGVFKTVFNALADNTFVSILLFNNKKEAIKYIIDGHETTKFTKEQIKDRIHTDLAAVRPGNTTDIIGALGVTASLIASDRKPTRSEIDASSIIFITDGIDNLTQSTRPDAIFNILTAKMTEAYGSDHLPSVLPIGIGLQYMEQLLAAIGNSHDFHRSGFLHIAQPRNVAPQSEQLVQTVDPIKLKTDIFIILKDGTTKLLPWADLRTTTDKAFTCDSSKIAQLYLIHNPDTANPTIVELIDNMPALDALVYNDAILKLYLTAENARISTAMQAGDSTDNILLHHERIRLLLTLYPKAYWHKDSDALTTLENLEKLYIKTDDVSKVRNPVRIISTRQTDSMMSSQANIRQRDGLLSQASALSGVASASISPGGNW